MQSHCNSEQFEFEGFGRHKVTTGFDDGAAHLLLRSAGACFTPASLATCG